MTQIPINTTRFQGLPLTVVKTREIFKVQISLDAEKKILVYNADKSRRGEFSGGEAKDIAEHFQLNRFTKTKTYVYGNATDRSIALEGDGEVPFNPGW